MLLNIFSESIPMPHRRENKYLRPPAGYTPPTDPHQQAIRPPIGGVIPSHDLMVPPPIVTTPPPGYLSYEIKPPIGGVAIQPSYLPPIGSEPSTLVPSASVQPPIGAEPIECCSFAPPIGSEPSTLIPSAPIQPPTGAHAATLIPSYQIQPPIGGAPMPYRTP
ncbi:hypothetical protein NIES2135_10450 [Leptolyngbya boryana NIES-2135]|jgi:hypothetical protein|uniref:Uncharacterized protein n=2 Tax=Leptolyngbya group TaxID=3081713 RepID=A0A1Z4JBU1_LEPBY|nr:hypothetical protein LBWT_53970 [Leptolyngbya boryana IAM M-101]BAS65775.1 hypothetical protein LBDG_53970 [Leptolyngbya boryana dg5]BAY54229.1 hypothetical protein NIES2135_10450 [Leptolyngbya boryana NIES-2135]